MLYSACMSLRDYNINICFPNAMSGIIHTLFCSIKIILLLLLLLLLLLTPEFCAADVLAVWCVTTTHVRLSKIREMDDARVY